MLHNFKSSIGKNYFWPLSQVILRLECIGDETINNLTMKRVVCLNAVQNVGTSEEHQNDQVSNQGLLEFSKGECNKGNEFFSANENDVESLPNLEDMCHREVPPIGHSSWPRRE
jgi:hypothetical protein